MQLAKIYITLLSSFYLICFTDCKREYIPPVLQKRPRLTVADGTLKNAPDSTYITLTCSRNISDSFILLLVVRKIIRRSNRHNFTAQSG